MPQRLVLVRHGHTGHNKRKILQGWLDTELDNLGLQQAKLVAKRLAQLKFDAFYASDLKRAWRTAQEIAKETGLKPQATSHLRETNLGVLQGLVWEDRLHPLYSLWENLLQATQTGDLNWNRHQGESLGDVYQRLKRFLALLRRRHANQTVLLVSHGGTINRFLELLNLKDLQEFISYHNTAVTILDKTSKTYKITLLNDASHLDVA